VSEVGLRYLLEAVSAGSMRAASDQLNIAPSSISRQITQLEEEYGIPLIERGRRSIKLTRAGELLIHYVRDQAAAKQALLARIGDLRSAQSGTISLAVGEGFLGQSFFELIASFNESFPNIHVDLMIASTPNIIRAVMEDEADLGLVLQTPHEPKIQVRTSVAQPLKAVMNPRHRLARKKSVTLADLQNYPLCLASRQFYLRQLLAVSEAHQQTFLNPVMSTNSIQVMRTMAILSDAITVLPSLAIWSDVDQGRLVGVPIVDEALEHATVSLILRSGRQLEGAPLRMMPLLEALLHR
jgi:DNA-binding transcriptional LysR family regulator